jgi:23S rRNA (pseudouridine1915-N3)-methyltransferase
MKWKILAVGKPSLNYAKYGVTEYLDRMRRMASVELLALKENGSQANGAAQLAQSEGSRRIVLDERGKDWTTAELVKQIDRWEMDRIKQVSVLVGGADGHTDEVRSAGDEVLRLSRFTLQHELALVVLLEQIYRAYTIKRGEPYHRE